MKCTWYCPNKESIIRDAMIAAKIIELKKEYPTGEQALEATKKDMSEWQKKIIKNLKIQEEYEKLTNTKNDRYKILGDFNEELAIRNLRIDYHIPEDVYIESFAVFMEDLIKRERENDGK